MANPEFIGGNGGLHRASEGSRRSGARAAAFWGVAIVAGLSAALLIVRYMERRTTTVAIPTTKIVVAVMELPLANRIRAEQVKLVDWPANGAPAGAMHDPKEAVDRILTTRVLAGEPIVTGRLAAKNAGNGLAALIPTNMRAIAVHVDDVVGVAGFIHPDDRVDVIVTLRPTKPLDAESVSKVILQNVKVLAVGKELEVSDGNRAQASPTTVATLLVDPAGSERMALAANEGRIMLTLRSWTDNQDVVTGGMKPSGLLADVAATPVAAAAPSAPSHRSGHHDSAPVRAAPAIAPTVAVVAAKKDVVEILRGDRFEERKFDARDKAQEVK
ncbi:MAG TPA: Flp pilus assembly protein CpaB [Polyangia bacterium]|nr:Flp pilus assembly protein CpaB [Polyangia bacterium]